MDLPVMVFVQSENIQIHLTINRATSNVQVLKVYFLTLPSIDERLSL